MALIINQVTKRFGQYVAVDELQLEVPKGQIFGLLGANGAGKTTTIRMVLGLLEPTSGQIVWDNKKIGYNNSDRIGYLPEERGLYPKATIKDQILYLSQLRGMSKREALNELQSWLKKFHIEEYLDKRLEDLSKGNQQKIQFIAAVINRPELLFLDEPFSGLDPVNAQLLKETVVDLAKHGTTILFSSHRMEHIEELCENICILHKGKVVVKGNLKDIKRSYGRTNLVVHTDTCLDEFNNFNGITEMRKTMEGYHFKIAHEDVAQELLREMVKKGDSIYKFALEEPSLQEIFIDKVGGSNE